jgi:hypothetical protein
MYKLMKGFHDDVTNDYNSKWISLIENVLSSNGLHNIWFHKGDGFSFEYVKNCIKLRLSDVELQNWCAEVRTHCQGHFYAMFKDSPRISPFSLMLSYKDTSSLIKFACRNHQLPVTRDIFHVTTRQELMCDKCTMNVLGDEFHYLLSCPFFNDNRKVYLGRKCFVTQTFTM